MKYDDETTREDDRDEKVNSDHKSRTIFQILDQEKEFKS